MTEERRQRSSLMLQLLLAPFVILGLLSSLALFGRKKKETMPEKAARKVSELGLQQAINTAQQAIDDLRGQVASQDVGALREQVSQRAGTLVDTARTTVPPATANASEMAREVAANLAERFKTEFAPAARDWAQEAVEEAEEILQTARQKATELTETAKPVVQERAPEIGARATAAAGLVAGTAATAAQAISKRASSQQTTSKATESVQRVTGGVQQSLSQAGQTTAYAVSQTTMILFWLGALGAVIYYGILSESQRDKVRNYLSKAGDQIQALVAEFQGVDGELPDQGQYR